MVPVAPIITILLLLLLLLLFIFILVYMTEVYITFLG
jgi:hypothetical protein